MDYFGLKFRESPVIPDIVESIETTEESILDWQSGNILFRLFTKPPQIRKKVVKSNVVFLTAFGTVFLHPRQMDNLKLYMNREGGDWIT